MTYVRKTYTHSHDCPWQRQNMVRLLWVEPTTGVYFEARPMCADNDTELELTNVEKVDGP